MPPFPAPSPTHPRTPSTPNPTHTHPLPPVPTWLPTAPSPSPLLPPCPSPTPAHPRPPSTPLALTQCLQCLPACRKLNANSWSSPLPPPPGATSPIPPSISQPRPFHPAPLSTPHIPPCATKTSPHPHCHPYSPSASNACLAADSWLSRSPLSLRSCSISPSCCEVGVSRSTKVSNQSVYQVISRW